MSLSSPSSLQRYLEGIPKGRREGPTVIEVPVEGGQGKGEQKTDRAGAREGGEEGEAIAEAVLELARSRTNRPHLCQNHDIS